MNQKSGSQPGPKRRSSKPSSKTTRRYIIEMKMKKRLLAVVLILATILSITPLVVFSTEGQTKTQIDHEGDTLYFDAEGSKENMNKDNFVVSTSKTISPEQKENEFEITLQVNTTVNVEQIEVSPDAAVVIAIDVSDSMNQTVSGTKTRLDAAKEAAIKFLDSFVAGAGETIRKLSIVTFGGKGLGIPSSLFRGYAEVALNWTDIVDEGNLARATEKINSLTASKGTFTQGGLMLARNLYLPGNAPVNEKGKVIENRYVILLTDGDPNLKLTMSGSSAPNLSSTSITNLEGDYIKSATDAIAIPPSRNFAEQAAMHIINGGFHDNYTARLYTIGFGIEDNAYPNYVGGTQKYTGDQWLREKIASTTFMHYIANDIDELSLAFEKISEAIIRMANAWIVTDPMAEHMIYDPKNVISDNNTAKFEDGTLLWIIKDSDPVKSEIIKNANNETTIYTYELKYKISLDNLTGYKNDNLSWYKAGDVMPTNGKTFLTYVVDSQKAEDYKDEDFKIAEFDIPMIHGFDAGLEFKKVDKNNNPLEGAEFGLYSDGKCINETSSDIDGIVSFKGIPSGHSYILKEDKAPEGYRLNGKREYLINVSYGKLEIESRSPEGFEVENSRKPLPSSNGAISVKKTVDGIDINTWLEHSEYSDCSTADLIECFNLYKAETDGAPPECMEFIGSVAINEDGNIILNDLYDGWYAMDEVLTSTGKKIFEQAPIMFFEVVNGKLARDDGDFDSEAEYSLSYDTSNMYMLNANNGFEFTALNNGGEVFPISISTGDKTYASFCANAGSKTFSNYGYKRAELPIDNTTKHDILSALNYIYSKYGSVDSWNVTKEETFELPAVIDSTRLITQAVIWHLLNGVDINLIIGETGALTTGWSYGGVSYAKSDDHVEAILDVLNNLNDADGAIKDFAYLVCAEEGCDNTIDCQPQLVPIYGSSSTNKIFNNTLKRTDSGTSNGSLTISASAALTTSTGEYYEIRQGEKTPYKYISQGYSSVTATNAGYKNNLPVNPKNGNYLPNDGKNNSVIVPNSNHFTFATLHRTDLINGVDLALVIGNKIEQCGSAFVQLVDNNLKITINNMYTGSFGAIAFNKLDGKTPSNGNIHSQKEKDLKDKMGATTGFKTDSKGDTYLIPCPSGDIIYIYIHGDFQFDVTDKNHPDYEDGYIWEKTATAPVGKEYSKPTYSTTYLDVFVNVYNTENKLVESFTIRSDEANPGTRTLELPAGIYTIEWTIGQNNSDNPYTGTIEVKEGKTVEFPYISADYEEATVWTEAPNSPIMNYKPNPVKIVKQ